MGRGPGFHVDHMRSRRRLRAYLDGELSTGRRRRIERHAEECEDCGRLLASLQRLRRGLAGLRAPGGDRMARRVISRLRADHRERASG